MACAVIASAAMLAIPLCVRYITTNLLQIGSTEALHQIYMMGGLMLGLIGIYAACHAFIDYKGHVMGASMERDMRVELFKHYQKLSLKFYDEHKTGQLMTRISLEKSLYKAYCELLRLQNIRPGINVLPPISVDVSFF